MTPAEKLARERELAGRPGLHRPASYASRQTQYIVHEPRLLWMRRRLQLRQVDVANATGIHVGNYVRFEHGREVKLSEALKLARFFGCSIEEIWR